MKATDFATCFRLISTIYDRALDFRVISEASLGSDHHLTQMAKLIVQEAEEAKDMLKLAWVERREEDEATKL